ncbi:PLD nuclease N-terminal domain-containing protein [Leucobacter sp. NPDC058333]|uniref:PLD nuclease N-terminal domain-containing protein n=1 Tax=Leucobacter sp. NPDC058333 TaxID=3346450 RepID=UPI00365FD3AC
MVRFVIIGIVVAVALTLYALVDAAMTDGSRARGVAKPVWILLIVILPVIGALLWFFIGKGSAQSQAQAQATRRAALDDDPRFTGARLSDADLDAHMRELEERLRELDNETFPGETPSENPTATATASGTSGAADPQAMPTPTPNVDGGSSAAADADADAGAATESDSGDEVGKRSDGDAKP